MLTTFTNLDFNTIFLVSLISLLFIYEAFFLKTHKYVIPCLVGWWEDKVVNNKGYPDIKEEKSKPDVTIDLGERYLPKNPSKISAQEKNKFARWKLTRKDGTSKVFVGELSNISLSNFVSIKECV